MVDGGIGLQLSWMVIFFDAEGESPLAFRNKNKEISH